jgi:hypothetical protein
MKETPKRRIKVSSSLNEISTGQLGKLGGGGEMLLPAPFYVHSRLLGRYLKTTLTGLHASDKLSTPLFIIFEALLH